MKKFIVYTCLFSVLAGMSLPCYAVNVGTYKSESEYGLLDGFKINWKRQKGEKFIDVREKSTKKELDREYKYYNDSEYERTKYMYDGRAIL